MECISYERIDYYQFQLRHIEAQAATVVADCILGVLVVYLVVLMRSVDRYYALLLSYFGSSLSGLFVKPLSLETSSGLYKTLTSSSKLSSQNLLNAHAHTHTLSCYR
jgi:hypothetical protein